MPIRLYPVKSPKDCTVAIVAIEAVISNDHLHEVIILMLRIYQNFVGLIHDNERDTLTGLLNRKTFDYKINKILAQMQEVTKLEDSRTDQAFFWRFLILIILRGSMMSLDI